MKTELKLKWNERKLNSKRTHSKHPPKGRNQVTCTKSAAKKRFIVLHLFGNNIHPSRSVQAECRSTDSQTCAKEHKKQELRTRGLCERCKRRNVASTIFIGRAQRKKYRWDLCNWEGCSVSNFCRVTDNNTCSLQTEVSPPLVILNLLRCAPIQKLDSILNGRNGRGETETVRSTILDSNSLAEEWQTKFSNKNFEWNKYGWKYPVVVQRLKTVRIARQCGHLILFCSVPLSWPSTKAAGVQCMNARICFVSAGVSAAWNEEPLGFLSLVDEDSVNCFANQVFWKLVTFHREARN